MKIRTKILLAFSLLFAIFLTSGYIFFEEIGKIKETLSKNVPKNFTALPEMEKIINNSQLIILLMTIAICSLIVLSALFFSALLSRSVKMLRDTIESVKRGNLSVCALPQRNDEAGKLSKSFCEMTDIIKNSQTEAQKKVQEQTTELSEKTKDLDDQKNAILNILEDVDKEKEKTEALAKDLKKFQLAVENAAEMVVITDPEGILVYGNKAVKRITGYEISDTIGKKAAAFWKSPMPKEYYREMWRVIKTEKKTFHGQLQNKRKNGEVYEADISLSPVLDDNGNIIFFVGIERDITKEKEIDRAKTEFVSLASHQLRTPLSSINWYTEMLLGGEVGELNDGQKNYLK